MSGTVVSEGIAQALDEARVGAGATVAEPYLVVENVGKRFGTFTALEGVSLSIAPGEFVSFVGPSGCGKTTLLRAIAGLDPPSSGRIWQSGRDITGLPPAQRDFGIVFQSYALFPNLTIAENIGYGLRGREWPKPRTRERVAELLTLIGLSEHSHKYPAQMSGGQQQRVALARAIAAEPGLLLLDEPLSALDATVRLHLRSEIRALQRRLGVTTIMVTHDQEEAMSVSDRLVVMSRGRIEQVGTPEMVYRAPQSPFVAGFIGRSAAFDGVVQAGGVVMARDVPFTADRAAALPLGAEVRIFIRPEDVIVGPDVAAQPNALTATVLSVEFLGAICRLALKLGAAELEADVRADHAGRVEFAEGSRVAVLVPSDRVLVYPANV